MALIRPPANPITTPLGQPGGANMPDAIDAIVDVLDGPIVENVRGYGAKGDGTTDDTAAIQAAIDAAATRRGTVFFPATAGTTPYKFTTLNLNGKNGVRLQGSTNGGGVTLSSDVTGAGRIIDMRDSLRCWLSDLRIDYTSASFTGTVVDCSKVVATPVGGGLENVRIHGSGNTSASRLIDLTNTITFTLRNLLLGGAAIGVYGRGATGDYSNAHLLEQINFVINAFTEACIKNIGDGWSIHNCVFEPLVGNVQGAVRHDPGFRFRGLQYTGNWHGDAGSSATSWIQLGPAWGALIGGNNFAMGSAGTAIQFDENAAQGITILGNYFNGNAGTAKAVDFGATTGHLGISYLSNMNGSVVTPLAGTLPPSLFASYGQRLGFFGAAPQVKLAVTGSRGGNAALASLLTQLAAYGLITDSSTA